MKTDDIVLGIHDGHNASVALLKNGKIISAIQEERFLREKNYFGWPSKSIKYICENYLENMNDLSKIAIGSKFVGRPISRESLLKVQAQKELLSIDLKSLIANIPNLRKIINQKRQDERIKMVDLSGLKSNLVEFYEHHSCHAATAYYGMTNQDEKEWLVLTLDGSGDGICSTVSIGQNGYLKRLEFTSKESSLGNIYSRVTQIMGFIPWEHEYKLMGMAPYANQERSLRIAEIFDSYLGLDDKNPLVFKSKIWEGTSKIYKRLYKDLQGKRFDEVCAGLQIFTEDLIYKWVKECIKRTGITRIACAGGVFMNVKANKKISEISEIEELHIFPSCGDETISIGAAFLGAKSDSENEKEIVITPLDNYYLGPDLIDSESIEEKIANSNAPLFVKKYDNPEKELAKLIATGSVVARCVGKMEFGARALGNRSIIADPKNPDIIRIINRMVKKRDFWMPFAPITLSEWVDEYIINEHNRRSPYMMLTFDTKNHDQYMAAVHNADLTARMQILEIDQNPRLEIVLREFKKLTGRGVLLNTSFNLHGYPIVSSAQDAIKVFKDSGLEFLQLNDYIVGKKDF